MERLAVKSLTLRSIRGHDVLIDTTYDLDQCLISVANITRNLKGHTLRRSVEEVIWSCIGSILKGNVLDWIQMERESLIKHYWD